MSKDERVRSARRIVASIEHELSNGVRNAIDDERLSDARRELNWCTHELRALRALLAQLHPDEEDEI